MVNNREEQDPLLSQQNPTLYAGLSAQDKIELIKFEMLTQDQRLFHMMTPDERLFHTMIHEMTPEQRQYYFDAKIKSEV